MKKKNTKIMFFISFLILFVIFMSNFTYAYFEWLYQDDTSIMPASLCQLTCTDDATGDIYGIGFQAVAWHNDKSEYGEEEEKANECYLALDAYYGEVDEEGNFVNEDTPIWSKTLEAQDYGFYETDQETYSLTFLGDSLSDETRTEWGGASPFPFFGNEILYRLLYESFLSYSTGDDGKTIISTYNHKINNCVLNSKVQIHTACTANLFRDTTYINCDLYQGNERLVGDSDEESHTYHVECVDCGEEVTEGED